MADEQPPDDSGWRVMWAPFGNMLLIALLLYKLVSLIVDLIDRFIHPDDYKKKEKKLKPNDPS